MKIAEIDKLRVWESKDRTMGMRLERAQADADELLRLQVRHRLKLSPVESGSFVLVRSSFRGKVSWIKARVETVTPEGLEFDNLVLGSMTNVCRLFTIAGHRFLANGSLRERRDYWRPGNWRTIEYHAELEALAQTKQDT